MQANPYTSHVNPLVTDLERRNRELLDRVAALERENSQLKAQLNSQPLQRAVQQPPPPAAAAQMNQPPNNVDGGVPQVSPLMNALAAGHCTYLVTGKTGYVQQPWFRCKTCNLTPENGNRGVCASCVTRCHQGHQLVKDEDSVCTCDCPEMQGRCKCLPSAPPAAALVPPAAANGPPPVRFREFSIMDGQQEARSMLIPVDWQVSGPGLVFRLAPATNPCYFCWKATAPNGVTQLEVFPQYPFIDGIRQSVYQMASIAGPQIAAQAASAWPEGANYQGMEVRQLPPNMQTFMEQSLLPRIRRNIGYRVVWFRNLDSLIKSLGGGPNSTANSNVVQPFGLQHDAWAGQLRITYSCAGVQVEEDIVCTVTIDKDPQSRNTFWNTERAYAVRAATGKLDAEWKTFNFIIDSIRDNPEFLATVARVRQQLIQGQMHAIAQAGERSRIIARTNDEISKMITDTYNRRQAVQDKISHDWSQVMRGVETYSVPGTGAVELPTGYRDGWYNSSTGEYIMSDNTLFNPNTELQNSNGWWERLRKTE